MYRCDDNNWCRSATGNTTTCCPDQHYFTLPRNSLAQVQNGSAFVPGYTISAISGTSSSLPAGAIPVPPGQAQCNGSKDTVAVGVGTGIGIGIGVPLLVIIGSLVFLLRRQKQRDEQEHNEVMQRLSQEIKKSECTSHDAKAVRRQANMDQSYLVLEARAIVGRAELSGDTAKKGQELLQTGWWTCARMAFS